MQFLTPDSGVGRFDMRGDQNALGLRWRNQQDFRPRPGDLTTQNMDLTFVQYPSATGSNGVSLSACNGFDGVSNSAPSLATALEASLNYLEPLPEERQVHANCIQQLGAVVHEVGEEWDVQAFGSAANGFLSRGADLDITCFKKDNPDQDSQRSVQELKYRILPLLRQQPQFRVTQEVWSARVPIIRLRFLDIIDVDLSCHNPQALQNTHLLRAYAELSPRVRQLVLCVKCWAKAQDVCSAPKGYLSSYSFSLMVIYFLQVDQQLPCLPVEAFSSLGPTSALPYEWSCRAPLSDLVFRFFSFYAQQFAWGVEVVSVRVGRRKLGTDPDFVNLPGRQVQRLHVEDPFLPRNLNCVLGTDQEEHLKHCIQQAFLTISSNGVPQAFLQADPQKWLRQPEPQRWMWQPAPQQTMPLIEREMPQILPYPQIRSTQGRQNTRKKQPLKALPPPYVSDNSADFKVEDKKVPLTNGHSKHLKEVRAEPVEGKVTSAMAWLNCGSPPEWEEEASEVRPGPGEQSVPWTKLAGKRLR